MEASGVFLYGPHDLTGDDQALDFQCSFIDRGDPGISGIAFKRIVFDVSGSAMKLESRLGCALGGL
ncbi:conserved hypothetical protein [Roseibium sp. TrichSKD4]|nr:conserved hypothetical protein [Roseibium sp. TrichSKD4]